VGVIYAERNALLSVLKDYPAASVRDRLFADIHAAPFDATNPRNVQLDITTWPPICREFFTAGLVALALEGKNDSNYGTRYRK
jgi:hypothetical protein